MLNPKAYSPTQAFVAVLDALGAKYYTQEEVQLFLSARDEVLKLLRDPEADIVGVKSRELAAFVFNDTVVLSYSRKELTPRDAIGFCGLVRGLVTFFLLRKIFFRGAVSMGLLYKADHATNTIMGPALTDAAEWYERAEWIGVHMTPRATIRTNAWLQGGGSEMGSVLVDYNVPLRDKGRLELKAINWPKALYLSSGKDVARARTSLLNRFGDHSMPSGTELKYFHALGFFEHCHALGFSKEKGAQ
jgi:hypothetical protein